MGKFFKRPEVKLGLILAALLLVFVIKSINIENDPAGFFCDEAGIGVDAYSVMITGKDSHGVSFPLFFEAFGEYKSPFAVYPVIPFVKLGYKMDNSKKGVQELSRLPNPPVGRLQMV